MANTRFNRTKNRRFAFIGLPLLLLLLLSWRVSAQGGDGGAWVDPRNLSQSGTAVNPDLVVDPAGVFHLFWQDRLSGYLHLSGNGREWEPVAKVLVPFTDPPYSPVVGVDDFGGFYDPSFTIDHNDRLHAVWPDEDRRLLYSRTVLLEDGGLDVWTPIQQVAGIASAFSITAGPDNALHLAYISPSAAEETPTGVYYRQSRDGGDSWTDGKLLYQSDYLRAASPDVANIQVAVAENGQVFIVWDNPLIEKVLFTRSANGGASWSDPVIIDERRPDDALESPGARQISMALRGDEVHLVWMNGHEPRQCSVYHQVSLNNGASWEPVQKALDSGSVDCPTAAILFAGENELMYLMTSVLIQSIERSQLFMQAWDGEQWTVAEFQDSLFDFKDPHSFRTVNFDCLQPYVSPDNDLFMISCGSNRSITDVWVLERPLGEAADWSEKFAPPTAWSQAERLAIRENGIWDPVVLVDLDGRTHIFWNGAANPGGRETLYHMSHDGIEWSRPIPIQEASEGDLSQRHVMLDPLRNRFLVTWIDSGTLRPYFSQVNVDSVDVVVDWAEPLRLPAAGEESGWPQLALDTNGDIVMVSSVPVNENRGVYLTRSADDGVTWQEPVLLFDGVAEDWPLVGQAQVQIADDGVYHLLVKRPLSLSAIDSADLFYLQSSDAGQTWTTPMLVSNDMIGWSKLVVPGSGNPHVVYQVDNGGSTTTWHTYSSDGGATWKPLVPVLDTMADRTPVVVIPVNETNLYLFLIADQGIQNRWWDGQHWLIGETKELEAAGDTFSSIDANSKQGLIDVIYVQALLPPAQQEEEPEEDDHPAAGEILPESGDALDFLTYLPDGAAPAAETAPVAAPTETPEPTPGLSETAVETGTAVDLSGTPTPTPTPAISLENSGNLPNVPGPSNQMMILVVSIGLVAALVFFVFVLVILFRMRKNRAWRR